MPEIKNYVFSHVELAQLLIKHLDLHDGFWGITVDFSMTAGTVPMPPDGQTFLPVAMNFVQKIGLQRFPAPFNNLTVDASQFNPLPSSSLPAASSKKRHG